MAVGPAGPTSLVASVQSHTQINLTWSDNSSDETDFEVERKTGAGGTYSVITTLGANAAGYYDTGLAASTEYYYRVYAYNGVSNSAMSNETSATTQAPPIAMVSLLGGTFSMGDALDGKSDAPVHLVTLSAFEIDNMEVSNAQYQACVTAGNCSAPKFTSSVNRDFYYGNASFENYPVIYVSWDQATAYCTWAGKRLPTEAEWEYAARGGLSGKRFPWGDTITCSSANYLTTEADYSYDVDPYSGSKYCGTDHDASVGGSYAANGYGLYDMAGNVWEWVNDWYDSGYYWVSPSSNPKGPVSGSYRVFRGGSFNSDASYARASYREYGDPVIRLYWIGFRCAR